MQIAFFGLGKMGGRMAKKLSKEGHDVVVWNRSPEPIEAVKKEVQVASFTSIEETVAHLDKPRVLWLMLPAGEATDTVLSEVEKFVEQGDIIINGANNNFVETEKQHKHFSEKGMKFLGIGVSGGVIAEFEGYPLMVGGDKDAYEHITPVLDALSKPKGGHEYFGTGGAGHYVKMVHNAIEYAYMQGIGEGFGVLEKSEYNFDLLKVAKLYEKGSLISGFMMQRTIEAIERDPKLEGFSGVMGSATGETVWTVEEAEKKGLIIDVIKRSLDLRKESVNDEKIQKSFASKMVQALRAAFGGHNEKTHL